MSQSRIQVVFFDAADTLFHFKGPWRKFIFSMRNAMASAERLTRWPRSKAAFARSFRDAPPPVFAATEPAAIKQSERLWWFDIVHNVFYASACLRFDEFLGRCLRVCKAESWRLFPETLDVLKTLKAQGYEAGDYFQFRLAVVLRAAGLGIAGLLRYGDDSSLAHAAKPSARIFEQALEKHAVDPEDALHVGDSERDDVKGAVAVGLTRVLLAEICRLVHRAERRSRPSANSCRCCHVSSNKGTRSRARPLQRGVGQT